MSVDVANPKSDRVRSVRALAQASVRSRRDQFLVEGPQGVREAVRFAAEQVRDVYLTPDADERHPEIARGAREAGLYVHLTTPEALAAMSEDAQGVLAVLQRQKAIEPDHLLARTPRLVALLHQVRDPGNAGTVIRAADAAGADACILTHGSVDVHNPKVVRSTVGSLFHLPTGTGADLAATIQAARAAGMQVLAADGAGALDLDDLADRAESHADSEPESTVPTLAQPTLWLFGNEAHGLGTTERDMADAVVRIPIHGHAESLNLAMAATICLYASARAQR
ncbi:TrmH family RNA methyltransferase [Ruania halotolerans]|uniref:TrmH family RNA methyltransferase n=1 Tax=Ruania halotolerans TaxID=2897773 RepID=UPI001E3F51AF|nr:RNA methyltransferase [Ruania halotolerans]UFU05096.1 RNA methyltransferase [Ruania halotolerans]